MSRNLEDWQRLDHALAELLLLDAGGRERSLERIALKISPRRPGYVGCLSCLGVSAAGMINQCTRPD